MEIPDSENIKPNYENIVAECPYCKEKTTFNRISDIGKVDKISREKVSCEHCKKEYFLNLDRVDSAYILMLENSHDFINEKKYMNSILSTCQAYECFFSLYLLEMICRKTYNEERKKRPGAKKELLETLATLERKVYEKTKKFSFDEMRNMVLWHILECGERHKSFEDADSKLSELLQKTKEKPKDCCSVKIPCSRRSEIFIGIKKTDVHEDRNKVAHKFAYRPTKETAESHLEDARKILEPAFFIFKFHEHIDFNSHI